MAKEVIIVTVALPDIATTGWQGTPAGHVFRAPDDAVGGGVRVVGAYMVTGATTSGGNGYLMQLENWGTAGTAIKASAGTVAAALGGTTDHWVADTPKTFTLSNPFVDAGEYLVLNKTEEGTGGDPNRGVLILQYKMGV